MRLFNIFYDNQYFSCSQFRSHSSTPLCAFASWLANWLLKNFIYIIHENLFSFLSINWYDSMLLAFAITTYLALGEVSGLSLDTSDRNSVCSAASAIVKGELDYYEGIRYGGTVGIFQPPYYWRHSAEAFDGLIDYYTFCQPSNDTLKQIIQDALIHQAGSNYDFMPLNQTSSEASDDQGMWGMALMQAVERKFPDADSNHKWLDLVENVVKLLNGRWDSSTCLGGLRWQYDSSRNGYTYKNSITNGILFNLAGRLAKLTGKQEYVDMAKKIWDWIKNDVKYIVEDNGKFSIYDGGHVDQNCQDLDKTQWSYIFGVFISGNAYLYSHTGDSQWLNNVQTLWNSISSEFFKNKIMYEPSCMNDDKCNNDQRAFRSLLARNLKLAALEYTPISGDVLSYLLATAVGVANSCSGGSDGVTCGQDWSAGKWDGKYGLGEQMSALEVILSLIASAP